MEETNETLHWLWTYTGAKLDDVQIKKRHFDISSCYRVFSSFTVLDPKEKREDVLAPVYRVTYRPNGKAKVDNETAFRLFYKGAEEELTRYVYWLRNVYFKHETDEPAPVYIAIQDTHCVQRALETLYPGIATYFIGPNELEHYGLLTGQVGNLESIGFF